MEGTHVLWGLLHIISSLIDHINFFLNKNGPSQASFSFIFVFANKQYNSYHCEKSPSSIQCWDSNPRPWEHQSPPITTRPEFNPPPKWTFKNAFSCVTTNLRPLASDRRSAGNDWRLSDHFQVSSSLDLCSLELLSKVPTEYSVRLDS